jgi:hypothetical protein
MSKMELEVGSWTGVAFLSKLFSEFWSSLRISVSQKASQVVRSVH